MTLSKLMSAAVLSVGVVVLSAAGAFAQWPSYPTYPSYPQDQGYYQPYNPVVIQTPVQVDGWQPDWRTGGWVPDTSGTTVNQSYFDPDRNFALPGTVQQVNRWEIGSDGQPAFVTGQEWVSPSGVEHGNTERITQNPLGGTHTEQELRDAHVPNL